MNLNKYLLSKRTELSVNPVHPFTIKEVEDTTSETLPKGQSYSYHNFSKKYWKLNYPSIDTSDF